MGKQFHNLCDLSEKWWKDIPIKRLLSQSEQKITFSWFFYLFLTFQISTFYFPIPIHFIIQFTIFFCSSLHLDGFCVIFRTSNWFEAVCVCAEVSNERQCVFVLYLFCAVICICVRNGITRKNQPYDVSSIHSVRVRLGETKRYRATRKKKKPCPCYTINWNAAKCHFIT